MSDQIITVYGRNSSKNIFSKDIPINTQHLILCHNQILELDLSPISNSESLRIIDLHSNQLRTINLSPLTNCRGLQGIDLHRNPGISVNLSPLAQCKNLLWVNLHENMLENVDLTPLAQCKNLLWLNLHNNQLQSIDLSPINHCTEIQSLDLHGNPLLEIDLVPLTNCKKLKFLDLYNTRIKNLDITALLPLLELEAFYIDRDVTLVADMMKKPNTLSAGLQKYSERIQWETKEDYKDKQSEMIFQWRGKIIVAGGYFVGKTALIRALARYILSDLHGYVEINGKEYDLTHSTIKNSPKESERTVGVDTWLLRIPIKRDQERKLDLDLRIWDFAGDDTFYVTHQPFLTKKSIYLLVFCPENEEKALRELNYWYRRIRQVSGTDPIKLVRTWANTQAREQQWIRIKKTVKRWVRTRIFRQNDVFFNAHMDSTEDIHKQFLEIDTDPENPKDIGKIVQWLIKSAEAKFEIRAEYTWKSQIKDFIFNLQRTACKEGQLGVHTLDDLHNSLKKGLTDEAADKYTKSSLIEIVEQLEKSGVFLLIDLPPKKQVIILNVDLMSEALSLVLTVSSETNKFGRQFGSFKPGDIEIYLRNKKIGGERFLNINWNIVVDIALQAGMIFQSFDGLFWVPENLQDLKEIQRVFLRLDEMNNVQDKLNYLKEIEKTQDEIDDLRNRLNEWINLLSKENETVTVLECSSTNIRENFLATVLGYYTNFPIILFWRNSVILRHPTFEDTLIWMELSEDQWSEIAEEEQKRRTLTVEVRGTHSQTVREEINIFLQTLNLFLKWEDFAFKLNQRCGRWDCRAIISQEALKDKKCPNCKTDLDHVIEISLRLVRYTPDQIIQILLGQQDMLLNQFIQAGDKMDSFLTRTEHLLGQMSSLQQIMTDISQELVQFKTEFREFGNEALKLLYSISDSNIDQKSLMDAFSSISELAEKFARNKPAYKEMKLFQELRGIELGHWFEQLLRKHLSKLEEKVDHLEEGQRNLRAGLKKLLYQGRWHDLPHVVALVHEPSVGKHQVRVWFGCPRCGRYFLPAAETSDLRYWVRVSFKAIKAGLATVFCFINPRSEIVTPYGDLWKEIKSKDELLDLEINQLEVDHRSYEVLRKLFLGTKEIWNQVRYDPDFGKELNLEGGWICQVCHKIKILNSYTGEIPPKEFLELGTGTGDILSKQSENEVKKMISKSIIDKIQEYAIQKNWQKSSLINCLIWIARGLDETLAILKVETDLKERQ